MKGLQPRQTVGQNWPLAEIEFLRFCSILFLSRPRRGRDGKTRNEGRQDPKLCHSISSASCTSVLDLPAVASNPHYSFFTLSPTDCPNDRLQDVQGGDGPRSRRTSSAGGMWAKERWRGALLEPAPGCTPRLITADRIPPPTAPDVWCLPISVH